MTEEPDGRDRASVRALLGRDPLGSFEVVVRDDGRRAGRHPQRAVARRRHPDADAVLARRPDRGARREPPRGRRRRPPGRGRGRSRRAGRRPSPLRRRARRRARRRRAGRPAVAGAGPAGGVGGTRQGVKCLHAHYAWFLAGGDDPVGRWVAARLAARLDVEIGPSSTVLAHAGRDIRIPVGPATLLADELVDPDPATPAQLTNAIGIVMDHVDDVIREVPAVIDAHDVHVRGDEAWHLATVELGRPARDRRRRPSTATAWRTSSGPWPPRPGPSAGTTPASTRPASTRVLGDVLRRRRRDAPAAARRASRSTPRRAGRLMVRHPSIGSQLPVPLRLYGRRVTLRPLTPPDFPEWSEVRRRNDAWLTPWEPRRPPSQLDPTLNRDAFNARCAARDRDASAGVAYGFGVFLDHRLDRRGQPQQRPARRDAERHGRVLGRPGPGRAGADRRERRRAGRRSPSSSSTSTGWRSASSRATTTAAG